MDSGSKNADSNMGPGDTILNKPGLQNSKKDKHYNI